MTDLMWTPPNAEVNSKKIAALEAIEAKDSECTFCGSAKDSGQPCPKCGCEKGGSDEANS